MRILHVKNNQGIVNINPNENMPTRLDHPKNHHKNRYKIHGTNKAKHHINIHNVKINNSQCKIRRNQTLKRHHSTKINIAQNIGIAKKATIAANILYIS